MAVLFILVFTGYLCAKSGFFSHTTVMGLTNLIMYVVTPCIIILSFQREFDAGMLGALGVASLIAAGFHLLGILLAHSLIRDKVARRRRVLRFGVVFSNAGTMSLPLQQAILGLDGVFYGAAVIAVFNLVLWTYGLVLMSGDTKKMSLGSLLLNPGLIGIFVGLLFYIFSVNLHYVFKEPLRMISALNTPLPMLVIGFYLAKSEIVSVLRDFNVYLVMFLRLVVVPSVLLFILMLIGVNDRTMVVACVIAASAPCAATTTMFSAKFGQDTELSVKLVSFSNVVSVITMPLVVGTARFLTL